VETLLILVVPPARRYAHDTLCTFMTAHGFAVTPHYKGLPTAWRAVFAYGGPGRTLGVNAEMDALPGMGHACGHNLIAIAGVGVALAAAAALEVHGVPGRVVLLGTPAEEGGNGKGILARRGAYKEMDACVMQVSAPLACAAVHPLLTGDVWQVPSRAGAGPVRGARGRARGAADACRVLRA
jgi:metal-dependent amidase/aminoacylase/carboxypeptidase family protein